MMQAGVIIRRTRSLQGAYENSLKIIAAWREDQLVGIIRVVGDGNSIIYIQDILVRKEAQGQGIGSRLLTEILQLYKNVCQKVLLTDNRPDTAAFYKKLGFTPCNDLGCASYVILG
jgi:GNAT superfamily N-acetyltransferase